VTKEPQRNLSGCVTRRYAHKIPFLVKINHNETLSYLTTYDQTLFARVEQAFATGAVAIGATIYFQAAGYIRN
jgi:class I fructose-bisphosphate aldolase